MGILKKVLHCIRENQFILGGELILVGVSGGADSVGLLHVLSQLRAKLDFSLLAVHIHHGLRGEEADRDAEFVRNFCKCLGIDAVEIRIKVKELAKQDKIGEEEAGRKYRYLLFEKIRQECHRNMVDFHDFSCKNMKESLKEKNKDLKIYVWENHKREKSPNAKNGFLKREAKVKIALAHHKDDQAETILFHLIRGSGLRGCSGMQVQREDIIRPLLDVSRAEIEEYVKKKNLKYCTDSSNSSEAYARNILRNKILPTIRKDINALAADNIVRAGRMFYEADEYFVKVASGIMERHAMMQENEIRIPIDAIKGEADIVKRYVIRLAISRLLQSRGIGFRDIHYQHVSDVEKLAKRKTSAQIDLPNRMFAKKEYTDIIVSFRKENAAKKSPGGFVSRVFPYHPDMIIPKSGNIRWFDYDKLEGEPVLRNREVGDYFYLQGVGNKTLKSYLIDLKIDRERREELEVIACKHHIVWLIGYRTGDAFRVDEHTKRILEIEYKKEREDELPY